MAHHQKEMNKTKFTLRLPTNIAIELSKLAAANQMDRHSLIVDILSEYVNQKTEIPSPIRDKTIGYIKIDLTSENNCDNCGQPTFQAYLKVRGDRAITAIICNTCAKTEAIL